jgi:hypothetical protein
VTDSYEGERIDNDIIINIDIFKNILITKSDITVKINKQYKVVLFQVLFDNIELKYIVSTLLK